MTELPPQQPIVSIKPQSDLYTLIIILAAVALAVAVGLTLYNLLDPVNGYGFRPYVDPLTRKPATNAAGVPIHPGRERKPARKFEDGTYEATGYGLRFWDIFRPLDRLVEENRLPKEANPGYQQGAREADRDGL